jgi:hypothetical protein
MATPTYQGPGQPPLDNGGSFLGRIGSVFGPATPTYLGDGQPSSNVGALGQSAPMYVPAPIVKQVEHSPASIEALASCGIDPAALAAGHIVLIIPRSALCSCPIDPTALAAGRVAIVVPRTERAPGRDDVAATD